MTIEDIRTDPRLWATDATAGEPITWLFAGEDGLSRLSGPGDYSAAEHTAFRARLTRVQLDHVALEAFRATPHRFERRDQHLRDHPTPILAFILLAEGRMQVEARSGAFQLCSGECIVVDSRDELAYSASSEIRLLRALVGTEHIPGSLQRRGEGLAGPMERTALVDSFIAFVTSILRAAASGKEAQGIHLVRAVADLQNAVLAEAQEAASREPGSAPLQHRIEDHIDRHLADTELGPHSIAAALGISVRHAHGTFNEDDRTISRVIRERRLSGVATELQVARELPNAEDLTARYGFKDAQALQRAFRARYGMSLKDYHHEGHRRLD